MPQKYTPEQIISRAVYYGVTIALVDGELRLQANEKDAITDAMRRQVKAHKEELVAYLQVEADMRENPPLCATCLNQMPAVENIALPDDHEGFMYCARHHPMHNSATPVLEGLSDAEYWNMLRQEAQEAQARKLAAGEHHGKKRTA